MINLKAPQKCSQNVCIAPWCLTAVYVIPHPAHPTFMLADGTGAARVNMLRGEKHRQSQHVVDCGKDLIGQVFIIHQYNDPKHTPSVLKA